MNESLQKGLDMTLAKVNSVGLCQKLFRTCHIHKAQWTKRGTSVCVGVSWLWIQACGRLSN